MNTPTVQVEVVRPLNRVVRWKRDQVGNDLTCVLRWCVTHNEPVWVYDDGSFGCPHDLITQVDSEHELSNGPWESEVPT